MPGNLQAAAPASVLPYGLCSAFEEQRTYEVSVSEYATGESQREARATSPRRTWRQARKLKPAQLTELITFYRARKGGTEPFWFYDLRVSTPYGNYDATGASSNGRFAARFEGPFGFTLQLGRAEVSFVIVEIA